jgi:hypothetical protein
MASADQLAAVLRALTGLSDDEAAVIADAAELARYDFVTVQCARGWGKLSAFRRAVEMIAVELDEDNPVRAELLEAVESNYRHKGYDPTDTGPTHDELVGRIAEKMDGDRWEASGVASLVNELAYEIAERKLRLQG